MNTDPRPTVDLAAQPGILVDRDNAAGFGPFSEYRKVATTRISGFTMPPGTIYQTPEGLRAEDEETRIAFDVQDGVYPIRESVFRASYAAVRPADGEEGLLRKALEALVTWHNRKAPQGPGPSAAEVEEWWDRWASEELAAFDLAETALAADKDSRK